MSLFNDVLGPVMRGPSSSHCAAALRIGRIARDLMGGVMSEVLVEFDRNGSLPTTHATQGSDMGLFGGLLGWDADDERLPDSATALADAGIALQFRTVEAGDPHPNTYRLTLRSPDEEHSLIAVSTGGGMIQVLSIDGAPVAMDGGTFETLIWLPREAVVSALGCEVLEHAAGTVRLVQVSGDAFATLEFTVEDDGALRCCVSAGDVRHGDTPPSTPRPGGTGGVAATFEPARVRRIAPVLPVLSRRGVRVPFTTCAQMLADNADRNASLWQLAIEYESARSGLDEAAIMERMFQIVRILRRSLAEGLAGTSYEDRILGVQSDRFAATMKSGRLLDAGALNRMLLNVTALMEVKSAMGVIVAMPTAGACAALPGAVLGMADELHRQEHEVARAFLAGGLVGVFIATAWSFAAEAGGCQAECGSASAMAAAALVTLADGTLQQALSASSMALQNMLGLVCDPVANRVEAPCLGKNAMAAANALSCANMALAGYDELIPLDEVIGAAKRVGEQLPKELRCTALGGLSVTPTSKAIEQRLCAKCRRDD